MEAKQQKRKSRKGGRRTPLYAAYFVPERPYTDAKGRVWHQLSSGAWETHNKGFWRVLREGQGKTGEYWSWNYYHRGEQLPSVHTIGIYSTATEAMEAAATRRD